MELRHEVKHEIDRSDMMTIRHRLRAVAYPDPHAIDGTMSGGGAADRSGVRSLL